VLRQSGQLGQLQGPGRCYGLVIRGKNSVAELQQPIARVLRGARSRKQTRSWPAFHHRAGTSSEVVADDFGPCTRHPACLLARSSQHPSSWLGLQARPGLRLSDSAPPAVNTVPTESPGKRAPKTAAGGSGGWTSEALAWRGEVRAALFEDRRSPLRSDWPAAPRPAQRTRTDKSAASNPHSSAARAKM
jgi:hypothetical protein